LNGPEIDLNLLRANSLYGNLDRAEAAKKLIRENEKQGYWLIFYSHDVAAQPSRFGCTPALLHEVCSFAAERGARFMTVAQVMKDLGKGCVSQDCCEVETKPYSTSHADRTSDIAFEGLSPLGKITHA
jgi:hypothetical protein